MNLADRTGHLPPELQRAVPRHVRLTVAGKLLLAAALLSVPEALVFGVWLYEFARRSRGEAEERRRSAVVTEGIVTRVGPVAGKSRRRIEYEFSVDGRKYRGSFSVRAGRTWRYEPGSSLKVAYLPADPGVNWAAHQQPADLPLWLGPVFAACILAVGAGLLAWLRSQRRLLEDGRAAVGVVTRVEKLSGKGARYRVHYEFKPPGSGIRTGRYDTPGDPPAPGESVVLVYDPENPRRQRRYPFPLVRVDTG